MSRENLKKNMQDLSNKEINCKVFQIRQSKWKLSKRSWYVLYDISLTNYLTFFSFQEVAKKLKDSTKKLCRQLQKKPDVEGNQTQVHKHKLKLIDTIEKVIREMNGDSLSFSDFRRMIEDETAESDKYEQQKDREK